MTDRCTLCDCELTNTDYGRNLTDRSRHHRLPLRLSEWTGSFPEEMREELIVLCYWCHEEMIHNPILLPGVEQQLCRLFAGKGLDERLRLFAEAIEKGAAALLAE